MPFPFETKQIMIFYELDQFEEWAELNHMKLNNDKCSKMKVSFLRRPILSPPLTLCNIPLNAVDVTKILGLNIKAGLKWRTQVAAIRKKANGRLFLLKTLRRFNLTTCRPSNYFNWLCETSS